MRKRFSAIACLLAGVLAMPQTMAVAADSVAISSAFSKLTTAPILANPSVVVMDEKSGEIIYQSNANSPRKPASVIKLISATAAYTYLAPTDSFTTSMWEGIDSKSVVIQGSLDPWMSFKNEEALKMKRTSISRLEYNALSRVTAMNAGSTKGTVIYISNLYAQEIAHFEKFLKDRKASTKIVRVSNKEAIEKSGAQILSSTSPMLEKTIDWMLTWSDNLLAERIARLASVAAGNTLNSEGVAKTFNTLLNDLGISTANLKVKDASGLSRENRVTATQISQLLMIIYHEPKFKPLVDGLPVGGISGTLQERFIETAPGAIGLVRAKTGTLNGTTNLAGYVQSGEHEYIFVIIADLHSRSYSVTKKVRATVDRILGRIATPLLPEILPVQEETLTATN